MKIDDKVNCCGCGACSLVCPKKCIQMKKDEEGFLYPEVDEQQCVNCGKCEAVCAIRDASATREDKEGIFDEPVAIGGWHKDAGIREKSSSGGAFTLFAEGVINKGGEVFACALNDKNEAVHMCVNRVEDLDKLRRSKYVQSVIGDVYAQIKSRLTGEHVAPVLFVGTPCQVAGLKSFLGREYENLYTIDFICHGVPSPDVFHAYLESVEQKENKKIQEFSFRNKDHGWNQSGLQLGTKIVFADNSTIRKYPAFKDPYMNGFLGDLYLRPSCYDCKFKTTPNTNSDFTIADFWGVDNVSKELNDGKGTSLILLNNSHAKQLWDEVKDGFVFEAVDYKRAVQKNKTIKESAKMNCRRAKFFALYDRKGYHAAEKRFLSAWSWVYHKMIGILFAKFQQFIKFGIVGVLNTVICLVVYYVLMHMGIHYIPAYICGFLTSVINAYFWNSRFVFTGKKEQSAVKAFAKVLMAYGGTFLSSIVMVTFMVEVLKVPEEIAPIIKMVITIPVNYLLNKFWAFKEGPLKAGSNTRQEQE
ncbi:MAG: Coenzyme F420 hydrogenase/dehydrogenase, beta subunit C-terminal domain [Acetatifactor sp.]|nr:Coenzyme F420 hydrogenase/dehydrogenase, beta subunit C-terminal domain [Acetatifactor sp.]